MPIRYPSARFCSFVKSFVKTDHVLLQFVTFDHFL